MKTEFKKKAVCFWLGFVLFLLLISLVIVYLSLRDEDYRMLGVTVFTVGSSMLIYFCILFDLNAIHIDIKTNTIQFNYPFSFKKKNKYSLTELLGYYIFTEGSQRRIVLIFNNKKEYPLIETYYSNFKKCQDYIFDTYQMISHKNYKVYSGERKSNEMATYIALHTYSDKEEYEQYTFKLYGLLIGAIVGILYGMFRYGFEFNWLNVIAISLVIILYIFIRNRKYVSTLEKEDLNKEKE
jgi:hypothetical protein